MMSEARPSLIDMSHGLIIRHRSLPGRREDLIAAWQRHMPDAIDANDGHETYVYTAAQADPDVLWVYQQYTDADAAAAFLRTPAYLAYLADSEALLAEPAKVVPVAPIWAKKMTRAA